MATLPEELWLKVIENLNSKDLKNARLVKSSWAEFATPVLFRNIAFSPEPANIKHFKLLAKNKELANHVELLTLDTTTYQAHCNPERYAKLASEYFSKVFGLGAQNTGPLSPTSLHHVLLNDPYKALGSHYLSGQPRGSFVAGYTLYSARSHFMLDLFKKGKIFQIIKQCVSSFKNLKHMETCSYWTANDGSYQRDFELYLCQHLPQKTLDLIPGLDGQFHDSGTRSRITTSAFSAPGAAARDLHVMMLPPNYGISYHDVQMHEITHAALRALRENKIRLQSLSLPGNDYLGKDVEAGTRRGIVPMTTLLLGAKAPGATKSTSLLLPVLRRLKSLELNIDFKHPATHSPLRDSRPPHRLCMALQQMNQLESLSLGSQDYLLGDPAVWDLTHLMLWKKEDYPDHPDALSDDGQDGPGGPHGLGDLMNMLMAMGPPPGLPLHPHHQSPATGTLPESIPHQGSAPTPNASSSQAAAGPGPNTGQAHHPAGAVNNLFAQIMGGGVASIDANGHVTSHTFNPGNLPHNAVGGSAPESTEPKDVKNPDTPLSPNPWPKLRYLSLWSLPATPEELTRLVTTVKDTLRTLRLYKVHYARPELIDPNFDDGHAFLDMGFGGPPPNNDADEGSPSYGDDEEDDEDLNGDLPELVDLLSAASPPGAQASSSSTATSIPANPFSQPAPPFNGHPPEIPSQPNTSNNSGGDDDNKDTSDKWLSTFEMLADDLRLKTCNIILEDHDELYLRDKLEKQITDLDDFPSLGHMASHYILDGDGMGYPLYLTNKLKEQKQRMAQIEADLNALEDDDGYEDWQEDGDHEDRNARGPTKMRNIHICSRWQGCP
ncbi:uncharacterized protein HMPREF1541_08892 [Cyphellophora europaea CBS 101466]|uniref:F-box domain-containing protein n=1 Tax=Cyphellophora europaea (strain CBS 101466) TaxID=1220924 RepID=W2RLK2_CYPE1|nr:uncharacterized protein HMPREF1541_08892 [Cyphellophora europaea CBS 101466]ETN36614.1 hypothetical protein HMPREF1541_08892 [Cyphellophora europaea CBS 101466]